MKLKKKKKIRPKISFPIFRPKKFLKKPMKNPKTSIRRLQLPKNAPIVVALKRSWAIVKKLHPKATEMKKKRVLFEKGMHGRIKTDLEVSDTFLRSKKKFLIPKIFDFRI